MEKAKKALFIFVILVTVFLQLSQAQLTGVGYSAVVSTNYKINSKPDSVFVFNANETNFNTVTGTLKVTTIDLKKGWTIYWSKFNSQTLTFELTDSFKTDSIIVRSGLSDGGYRVRMVKNTIDTTYTAWIFINKLRAHLKKTDKGNVPDFDCTCEYVELGIISPTNTRYDSALRYYHNDIIVYDPTTMKPDAAISNSYSITWAAVPELEDKSQLIKKIKKAYDPMRIYNPPAENTTFTFTLSDRFGNSATDKVYYKTIVTKADFKYFVADSVNNKGKVFNYKEGNEGEAPLHAKFNNKSKHGEKFEWIFSDTLYTVNTDSLRVFRTDSLDSVTYVYNHPDTAYKVKLISTSIEGCIDTSDVKLIKVFNSKLFTELVNSKTELAFPNCFIPGSINDSHFGIKNKSEYFTSIRKLHLVVFNQWGKKMYEYDGPVYEGWKGWDGKTLGNRDAVPGVYFYVYEAVGWGPFIKPKPGEHSNPKDYILPGKGFVHLFRQ